VISFDPPIMDGGRPLVIVVAQEGLNTAVLVGLSSAKKPDPPSRDPDPSQKRNMKARRKALELLDTDQIDQIARSHHVVGLGMMSRDQQIDAIIKTEFE
jgi:hypothetical protein